ncbi:MAG: hypothetical protein AAGF83_22760 [Cyanobacteria bacterium P01_G01_bin.67]
MQKVDQEEEPDWAEVQIDFATADGSTTGNYKAKIEAYGEVISAFSSAKEMKLEEVNKQ